jgi:hypothetical protein
VRLTRTRRRASVPLGPIIVLLALFWVRELWLPPVGGFLVQTDKPTPSQAIVPLAGDKAQVLYAVRLWQEGYGKRLVATETQLDLPGVSDTYAELVFKEARQHGVPEAALVKLSRPAQNPYQEALYLRSLSLRKDWNSLLIISPAQQSRRIRLIYKRVFAETEVRIRVVAEPFNPNTWWKTPQGLGQTLGEYGNLLLTWVGYR